MFEVISTSSTFLREGAYFVGRSLESKKVVQGRYKNGELSVFDYDSGRDFSGYDESYIHAEMKVKDEQFVLVSAHYPASLIKPHHHNLNVQVLMKENGERWACNLNNQRNRFVVLFNNEKTKGRWVLYEYTNCDLSTGDGKALVEKVLQSKCDKGYSLVDDTFSDLLLQQNT